MRDNDHDGTETLQYTTENRETINTYAGRMVLIGRLRCEAMTSVLSVVAARLIEASVTRGPPKLCEAPADGCIDDSYGLLIKRLRTDTVHGQRMLFVDCGPQFFPLLENFYGSRKSAGTTTPINYRSLSRRQVGILQMIARGMSNKCIARSLGIAPETVKTHAKGILSKLEARTRAQAVARAEAIGLL
jgi:DNA-binding CsgD family transcriptional regulator